MQKRILIINGAYREGGYTDVMVEIAAAALQSQGIATEEVRLRDYPIDFCHNCRHCTQAEGEFPGRCILDDNMGALIAKLEAADGYLFASPTNYGTVTALFKRFLERLVVYGYWPWGSPAPKYRKTRCTKAALCFSSCAAPSLLGRWDFHTLKALKMAARNVGAKVVGTLLIGLVGQEEHPSVSAGDRRRILRAAKKLADVLAQ